MFSWSVYRKGHGPTNHRKWLQAEVWGAGLERHLAIGLFGQEGAGGLRMEIIVSGRGVRRVVANNAASKLAVRTYTKIAAA